MPTVSAYLLKAAQECSLTDRLEEDAAKMGLKINCGKSEIMKSFTSNSTHIRVDGVDLKEKDRYK